MEKHIGSKTGLRIIAAAAALAAGAYFLYGKDGAKNRKKVKAWMLGARAEILERMEKARDMSKEDYFALVDKVISRYEHTKAAGMKEAAALARELKAHWKHIQAAGVQKKK